MPTLHDQALCLRHWDWSETSQTAAIFTRLHGVVRVLAKGSRRPKGAFSGGIELLGRAEVGFIPKPNSELALLTSWDLRESFPALRRVLNVYNTGLYMADLVFGFVRDHDPHTELYDAMLAALGAMRTAADAPSQLLIFQWVLLDQCGFRPQIDADVRTGEALADESHYLFSASLGGVHSARDRAGSAPSPSGAAWRVRAETIELLRSLNAAPSPPSDPPSIDRANRLLASYARHILGAEPPTMPVLFGDRLAQ